MLKETMNHDEFIKTTNTQNKTFKTAMGIDMGLRNFLTAVTTKGDLFQAMSSPLLDLCKNRHSSIELIAMVKHYALTIVNQLIKWNIEAVYIGCCGGDYNVLCRDDGHPFIVNKVYEIFIDTLNNLCAKKNIPCFAKFNESYTSVASAFAEDHIPVNPEEAKIMKGNFSGVRNISTYEINDYIHIDADINGAINILRKAGFNVCFSEVLFDKLDFVNEEKYIKIESAIQV